MDQQQQQQSDGMQLGASSPVPAPPPPLCGTVVRQCCEMLRLPTRVTCTALTFLQRVQMKTADLAPDRLASACIFLACKVEEAAVRTNDMLNAVATHSALLQARLSSSSCTPSLLVGDTYQACKRQLIQDEQLLLRHLHFDLAVDQAHRHLYALARCWGVTCEALRVAVCLLNDAVCYCPAYGGTAMPPATAAAAALHIGAQLCKQTVQPWGWWRATGIADESMRSSCSALLELIGA